MDEKTFSRVTITSESPLTLALETAAAVPSHFSLTIPNGVPPRKYKINAMGETASGELTESAPIQIDVSVRFGHRSLARGRMGGDIPILLCEATASHESIICHSIISTSTAQCVSSLPQFSASVQGFASGGSGSLL